MRYIKTLLTIVVAVTTVLPFTPQADESGPPSAVPIRLLKRVGTSGNFYINPNFAFGLIKQDETLIRLSSAPDCDLHYGSVNTPLSFGGTFTISGDAVGQPGGPDFPIEITPDNPLDFFYVFGFDAGQAFYPRATGQRVTVSLQGADSVPKMRLTTLRSPRFADVVAVTSPTPTETGEIIANAADGFNLTWTVPPGPLGNQKLIAAMFSFSSTDAIGELRCSFPLKAGRGSVPAPLMKALKNSLGTGPAFGFIHVRTGDFEIVRLHGASYTVDVSHDDGPTFATGADSFMTIQ
jgi:hypothetical protein